MRRGTRYESRFDKHRYATFGEAAKVWLDDPYWQGKSKGRQTISFEHLYDYIGEILLLDVDDLALQSFKEARLKVVKPGTVDKDLRFVSTILNYAVRVLRWIPSAPLIREIKGRRMQPQAYSWEQQDAIFSKLPDYMLGPAIFAVNTGARMGEIIGKDGLQWTQLQEQPQMKAFLFVVDGKNGYERAIICNSIARSVVNRQQGGEYVFVRDGKMIKTWCREFKQAYGATGMRRDPYLKTGAHNLRHTFGTRLGAVGAPEWIIKRLLGHANSNITQDYTQPVLEIGLEWTEKLTNRFEYTPLRSIRLAV